jgi:hypothetical protein
MRRAKSDRRLAGKDTGKVPVRRAGVLLWRTLRAKSEASFGKGLRGSLHEMREERLRVSRLDGTSVVRRAGQRRWDPAVSDGQNGHWAESEERCGGLRGQCGNLPGGGAANAAAVGGGLRLGIAPNWDP